MAKIILNALIGFLVFGSLGCGNSSRESQATSREKATPDKAQVRSAKKEIADYQLEKNLSVRQAEFDSMVENEGEALRLKCKPMYEDAAKAAVESFIKRVYGDATSDELKALGAAAREEMMSSAEIKAEKLAESLKKLWIAYRKKDFAARESFISRRIVTLMEEQELAEDSFARLLKDADKILDDGLVSATREIKEKIEKDIRALTLIGQE